MDSLTQKFILAVWLAAEDQGVKWGSSAMSQIKKKKVDRKRSQNKGEGSEGRRTKSRNPKKATGV